MAAANQVYKTAPEAPAAAITPVDRLSFTVFLAVALHAALLLGVTFTFADKAPPPHTMEVTLAQHMSQSKPDKADFMAQFNQAGSGTLEKKALLTSTTESEFHDTVINETTPQAQSPSAPAIKQTQQSVITTTAKSDRKTAAEDPSPETEKTISQNPNKKTLLQRSLEIASLEARLDNQRQIYAKRPRIKRLTSMSTAASADAYYLNSWRRKVEKFGNLNLPTEARSGKLYGSLRLLAAIRPDGSLKEVILLESSGHTVLDDAAINIVRLAAPYAPFPDELRQSTDVLEIIRTWQFRKNRSLRSY
jgi:protein TonB